MTTITSPRATRSSSPVRALDTSAPSRPKLLAALRKSSPGSDSDSDSEDIASASEDDIPVVPSRATASIIPDSRQDGNPAEEDEQSDGGSAYERMKQRLAAAKKASESRNSQHDLLGAVDKTGDEKNMSVRTKAQSPQCQQHRASTTSASPPPSARSRRSSPGLFVTPNATPVKQSRRLSPASFEADQPLLPECSSDLQERVRRIRAERLAKKQEEELQRDHTSTTRRHADKEPGSESDGENSRKFTQQARPTRRAGKKAMEEMARDQQRISRNMQLTHQAKTKKRYTTKDLFAKLGFNGPNDGSDSLPTPDASSVLASSDGEPTRTHKSPLTSPQREKPTQGDGASPVASPATLQQDPGESVVHRKIDKGKGQAAEFPEHPWERRREPTIVQRATVEAQTTATENMVELSDSDDDIQAKKSQSRFPVFDRLPAKKSCVPASLQHLRSLAQLIEPSQQGKKGQKSVSLAEWEYSLAQKARQQANQAREAKIADMIARGAHVETEEEREKRQEAIEDMVAQMEKEREQDRQLAKMERDEAKRNGETIDDIPSSDEEDDEYIGSEEENAEEADEDIEIELSGSEDEVMEEEDEADPDNLVDNVADISDEPENISELQHMNEDTDVEEQDAATPLRKQKLNRSRKRVIEDEEDENSAEILDSSAPVQPNTESDAMAAFGFGNAKPGVGLTQMFAGTMADLESDSQSAPAHDYETEQNSLDFLRSLPDTQPGAHFGQAEEEFVPNSLSLLSPQKTSQTAEESQFSLGVSQVMTSPAFTRLSVDDFEPTQDAGFSFSRSPAGLVLPASTVETVILPIPESPIKQKQGKLQRGRRNVPVELSDVEEDLASEEAEESEDDIQLPPKPRDAFAKLQKGAKRQRAMEDFNKQTSMAKEAVMEQAEESEDEYAGIGGISDDEEGEEDQELKDMIDHADIDVDERQIAAFFADKSKREDEKNIAELYKKIQTGGLRRHAGGPGFDLSDSEDEAEIRQRRKRAEFQQQTRALLADDRVKALHDDQKKKAFFNSLADFADEADYDFLNMPADMGVVGEESQSQEGAIEGEEGMDDRIPDSQATDTVSMPAPTNPLKRKSPASSQKENRPPPNMRRTAASDNLPRRPITLADVQNSVSELLDDPHVLIPDSQFSDSEDEDATPAPHAASRKPIIDRLSLSRQSTLEESTSRDANMAFHAPARSAAIPGFRVPSLIRQATSNLSTTSQRSSGASTPTEGVRRGGTGKSNIHAQAREAERRAMLERKEGKRKEALRKKVEGGRKRVGGMRSVLGDLGGGFE